MSSPSQKPLEPVLVPPPPESERAGRAATFAAPGEKRHRWHLPGRLESGSPVGYRTRISLTRDEARAAMPLLSLAPPAAFERAPAVPERELFEECALGVLSSRQSTNFRGFRSALLGPEGSKKAHALLRALAGRDAEPLADASHTHVVLSRPYRTPFTLLLTFLGHRPGLSLATVPLRALRKRLLRTSDIPTIEMLPDLHLGILAEALERGAVVASAGRRRALVHVAPFCGDALRRENARAIAALEALAGITGAERRQGFRLALVAQVGAVPAHDRAPLDPPLARRLGANLLAFRSERAVPGLNADEKAPAPYQRRQSMEIPDALLSQCGRAALNAFTRWSGASREDARSLVLLDPVRGTAPEGEARLAEIRASLDRVTSCVVRDIPFWCDLPTGFLLSRNAARGKKAFALAGHRIVVGGLSRREVAAKGIEWERALRSFGAGAARAALYAELMGATEVPSGCDLLAGVCMMAGPVNQNDIGKAFYGDADLLAARFPGRDPTSLLVFTLKAKTVADPIGNEEQLMNPSRQGALVDLRPAPHEAILVEGTGGGLAPYRSRDGRTSTERAFAEEGNFVRAPDGREVAGNRGEPWDAAAGDTPLWPGR